MPSDPTLPARRDDRSTKLCPICGKLASATNTPFCSRRCGDVDLNRWLNGIYAVPVTDDAEGDVGDEPR